MTKDRAASGESSISQGKDGRWHGYVSLGLKEGGKRDRRHVAAVKRADVVRMVREIEDQRDAGVRLASGRAVTLEEWLHHWLTAIAVRRLRPKTYDGYSSNVRRHLVRLLGHHRLDRLQPEHVEAAWAQLHAEGLSPATVLLNHRILSRALKVAMQRGRVARNVAGLVDAPTVQRVEVVPLTSAEVRRMLEAARQSDNGARWRWRWPSVCGRARRWACSGRTSTSTPEPSPCGVRSSARRARDSSLSSRRARRAGARSSCPLPYVTP